MSVQISVAISLRYEKTPIELSETSLLSRHAQDATTQNTHTPHYVCIPQTPTNHCMYVCNQLMCVAAIFSAHNTHQDYSLSLSLSLSLSYKQYECILGLTAPNGQ